MSCTTNQSKGTQTEISQSSIEGVPLICTAAADLSDLQSGLQAVDAGLLVESALVIAKLVIAFSVKACAVKAPLVIAIPARW